MSGSFGLELEILHLPEESFARWIHCAWSGQSCGRSVQQTVLSLQWKAELMEAADAYVVCLPS